MHTLHMDDLSIVDESTSWNPEELLNLNYVDSVETNALDPRVMSPLGPPEEDAETVVEVSTTFFIGAHNGRGPPDLVLVSSDGVLFYSHLATLATAGVRHFGLSPLDVTVQDKDAPLPVVGVLQSSVVLNLMLLSIYNLPAAQYSPTLEALQEAVHALVTYGVPIKHHVRAGTTLHTALLALAPLWPLKIYSLAASYDLHDLAVPCSSHLLSLNLTTLTDDVCTQMGALYLKRIFFLHAGRVQALKRVLLPPPPPHVITPTCDLEKQKSLSRAWALACGYLVFDPKPDFSASFIESALVPLGDHLSCQLCRRSLTERVKALVVQWSIVKRTI